MSHHDENQRKDELLPVQENGKTYFRSLDEVAQTEEFKELVQREFPEGASELSDPVSRRTFLSLMGASVALAGFGTACVRRPEEKIVPYAKRPEDLVPGLPQFYATTMVVGDEVTGLVVEAHEGRPTKIEGNEQHPASLGATSSIGQGAILSLYDPDRTTRVFRGGVESDWASFDAYLDERLAALRPKGGKGLLVIHGRSRSPAFEAARAKLQKAFPQARIVEWEAASDEAVPAGTRLAFGQELEPIYDLDRADSILAVDGDLLGSGPLHLRYAKQWAKRRDPDSPQGMNRLWVAEPIFTVTGGSADHRLRIRAKEAGPFLRHVAALLERQGVSLPAGLAQEGNFPKKETEALARELASKRGKSLVAVGRHAPAEVQALAHAINDALGNTGNTVRYVPAFAVRKERGAEALKQATAALEAGEVDTLVILGGNPAYDAPGDIPFAQAMAKAAHRIHLSPGVSETSERCEWVLPLTHFLEAWGDAVAVDGTYSVVQPLIEPIWQGRSELELLSRLGGDTRSGHDIVRATFAELHGEGAWRKALHDGVVASTPNYAEVELNAAAVARAASGLQAPGAASASNLDVVFWVDGKVRDGRFANNGWLQELPDPMTKLTWTNAAMLSPATARELGVRDGEMLRVEVGGRSVDAGAWVLPGLADHTVALALGYGRSQAGRVGTARGFDVNPLRSSDALWAAEGAKVQSIGGTALMASSQNHQSMEGRPIVREANLASYKKEPDFAQKMVEHPPLLPLWKEHDWIGQQWGMVIDLNSCLGCNGCAIACQAENNIPIVGPEEVRTGRHMHWIRIDRYFASTNVADPTDLSEPEVVHQPVTCMQCENAPCENVCPVAATVHSREGGLNDMVYNRCIGTRYCSNNCPYKVRRFNFFDYHRRGEGTLTEVQKLAFNPDVTVRARGVMEKCTYCTQRINAARREAKLAGLDAVPDGTIQPACAQACPTQAITFGDVRDSNSRVSQLKKQARNYELLAELNTKPRTSYLARIRNPNPELVS